MGRADRVAQLDVVTADQAAAMAGMGSVDWVAADTANTGQRLQ